MIDQPEPWKSPPKRTTPTCAYPGLPLYIPTCSPIFSVSRNAPEKQLWRLRYITNNFFIVERIGVRGKMQVSLHLSSGAEEIFQRSGVVPLARQPFSFPFQSCSAADRGGSIIIGQTNFRHTCRQSFTLHSPLFLLSSHNHSTHILFSSPIDSHLLIPRYHALNTST